MVGGISDRPGGHRRPDPRLYRAVDLPPAPALSASVDFEPRRHFDPQAPATVFSVFSPPGVNQRVVPSEGGLNRGGRRSDDSGGFRQVQGTDVVQESDEGEAEGAAGPFDGVN